MLVPTGTLVMVVDGAHRALYRNEGEAAAPRLTKINQVYHRALQTAELGTDRPGRHFESASPARGGYAETDLHQQEEDGFAREAAEKLNALAAGSAGRIILVAPPAVIGLIRPQLSAAAKAALAAEIGKDYAERSAGEIADLLVRFEVSGSDRAMFGRD